MWGYIIIIVIIKTDIDRDVSVWMNRFHMQDNLEPIRPASAGVIVYIIHTLGLLPISVTVDE